MKSLKSSSRQTKGAITVFVSIVLSAVFLLIGVFTDGARLKLAQSQIARADRTALSSIMACYQNDLKDDYGLFGLYADNTEILEDYQEYLHRNLNIASGQNYLYGYSVENIAIAGTTSLLDQNIFEKQIMEFMKYRAPYKIASDLANKIGGIKDVASGAKIYKRVLETDKQASEIGNMQLSLEEDIGKINTSGIYAELAGLKSDLAGQNSSITEYNHMLVSLQEKYTKTEDKKMLDELSSQIKNVQEDISECIHTKNQLKDDIITGVNQLKSINSQAKDRAGMIVNKKKQLLTRIEEELESIKDNQDGIKELQKSYGDNLERLKSILNQDNSSDILAAIDNNIRSCEEIVKSSGNEADLIQTVEKLTGMEKISYTFNKSKPTQSEDQDNREKALQVLRTVMNQPGELKSIDERTFESLPSQLGYDAGDIVVSWDNMNFTDVNCAIQNMDYLSKKENTLENMIASAAEQIYINEYIMGTFKHGVPVLKGEEGKAGYNLRSKDKNDRDALFSAYEVEYILNGCRDEARNQLFTKSEILAVRLIANVIHIYTDASKMSRISSLAAALSAWSAGLSAPLIQSALVFSWAMLESLYDLDQLQKGEKILLFKSADDWKTDISGAVSSKKNPKVENNPLCLSYQDYLKIFLLMMDKSKKLARIQDLIQINTQIANPDFQLSNCRAGLQSSIAISIRNLFVSFSSNRSVLRNKAAMGY